MKLRRIGTKCSRSIVVAGETLIESSTGKWYVLDSWRNEEYLKVFQINKQGRRIGGLEVKSAKDFGLEVVDSLNSRLADIWGYSK